MMIRLPLAAVILFFTISSLVSLSVDASNLVSHPTRSSPPSFPLSTPAQLHWGSDIVFPKPDGDPQLGGSVENDGDHSELRLSESERDDDLTPTKEMSDNRDPAKQVDVDDDDDDGAQYVLELVVVEDRRASFSVSFLQLRRLIHTSLFHQDGSPCNLASATNVPSSTSSDPQAAPAALSFSMQGDAEVEMQSPEAEMVQKAGESVPVSSSQSVSFWAPSYGVLILLQLLCLAVVVTVAIGVQNVHRRRERAELLLSPPTADEVGLPSSAVPPSVSHVRTIAIEVPSISSSASVYRPLEQPLLPAM